MLFFSMQTGLLSGVICLLWMRLKWRIDEHVGESHAPLVQPNTTNVNQWAENLIVSPSENTITEDASYPAAESIIYGTSNMTKLQLKHE